MNEVSGDEQPTEVPLNHSPFWVRIRNLPFNCRSNDHVKAVASCLGELVEVEDDDIGIDKYCRVRVILDVRKPLRKKKKNIKNRKGDEVEIVFRYERIPFFCFLCGVLGHSERYCNNVSEEDRKKGFKWGIYLRASPHKGRMQLLEEVETVKATKKVLFVPKTVRQLSQTLVVNESNVSVLKGVSEVGGGKDFKFLCGDNCFEDIG